MKCYLQKQEGQYKRMCNHSNTVKVGNVKVCLKCGISILPNGEIFYDRKIKDYKPPKRKKGGK